MVDLLITHDFYQWTIKNCTEHDLEVMISNVNEEGSDVHKSLLSQGSLTARYLVDGIIYDDSVLLKEGEALIVERNEQNHLIGRLTTIKEIMHVDGC